MLLTMLHTAFPKKEPRLAGDTKVISSVRKIFKGNNDAAMKVLWETHELGNHDASILLSRLGCDVDLEAIAKKHYVGTIELRKTDNRDTLALIIQSLEGCKLSESDKIDELFIFAHKEKKQMLKYIMKNKAKTFANYHVIHKFALLLYLFERLEEWPEIEKMLTMFAEEGDIHSHFLLGARSTSITDDAFRHHMMVAIEQKYPRAVFWDGIRALRALPKSEQESRNAFIRLREAYTLLDSSTNCALFISELMLCTPQEHTRHGGKSIYSKERGERFRDAACKGALSGAIVYGTWRECHVHQFTQGDWVWPISGIHSGRLIKEEMVELNDLVVCDLYGYEKEVFCMDNIHAIVGDMKEDDTDEIIMRRVLAGHDDIKRAVADHGRSMVFDHDLTFFVYMMLNYEHVEHEQLFRFAIKHKDNANSLLSLVWYAVQEARGGKKMCTFITDENDIYRSCLNGDAVPISDLEKFRMAKLACEHFIIAEKQPHANKVFAILHGILTYFMWVCDDISSFACLCTLAHTAHTSKLTKLLYTRVKMYGFIPYHVEELEWAPPFDVYLRSVHMMDCDPPTYPPTPSERFVGELLKGNVTQQQLDAELIRLSSMCDGGIQVVREVAFRHNTIFRLHGALKAPGKNYMVHAERCGNRWAYLLRTMTHSLDIMNARRMQMIVRFAHSMPSVYAETAVLHYKKYCEQMGEVSERANVAEIEKSVSTLVSMC